MKLGNYMGINEFNFITSQRYFTLLDEFEEKKLYFLVLKLGSLKKSKGKIGKLMDVT
jgi:hypothetical protein